MDKKMRSKPPIKQKYIKDPDELLSLWNDYKDFIDKNPDIEEVVTNKGEIIEKRNKKPYLKQGFFSFIYRKLNFHTHQYFDNYKNRYDSYLEVVTHIRNEWEDNQISGTLTGKFKAPNLVARLNGVTEKIDTTVANKEGEVFKITLKI